MPGPPADPLTLALAVTVTLMLTEALADAVTAVPAQTSALPPIEPSSETTELPDETRFPIALTASGPWV